MSGGVSRRGGWLNPTPTRSIENGENAGHY